MDVEVVELEDRVTLLQEQIDLLLNTSEESTGSASSSPDESPWSTSEEGLTLNQNLVLYKDLNVLGSTVVSDLGVTGNIHAGLIVINSLDGSINSLANPLKLQNMLGAGKLDIFNGLIVMSPVGDIAVEGTVVAKKVITEEFKVVGDQYLGKAILPVGQTQVEIGTSSISTQSAVIITPETRFWLRVSPSSEVENGLCLLPIKKKVNRLPWKLPSHRTRQLSLLGGLWEKPHRAINAGCCFLT